jgi:hypothetical protein
MFKKLFNSEKKLNVQAIKDVTIEEQEVFYFKSDCWIFQKDEYQTLNLKYQTNGFGGGNIYFKNESDLESLLALVANFLAYRKTEENLEGAK